MASEKDLVLIYFEENPVIFARIESILPDAKPDWYHVQLLLLQVPPQLATWILRDIYIDGETFTMDGKKVRMELVESPQPALTGQRVAPVTGKDPQAASKGSVISLNDFKK